MTDRGRPLRLVFFSPSIVADVDNPAATSTRALLGALSAAGHDVTHLERRGNALLDRQLRVRGSGALRSLNARYPDVRVRQYDLPRGRQERAVWFGTEVSTADAVVALAGTPGEILELIAPFETPHLVRVVPEGADGDVALPWGEHLVCVEPRSRLEPELGDLAVAYDNIGAGLADAVPREVDRVVVGSAELPGWRYLPEVEVAELYRSARTATVMDGDGRPEARARALLPMAAGCRVWHRRSGAESGVEVGDDPAELSETNDAERVASTLVDLVRSTLVEKRRTFAAGLPGAPAA